MAKKTMGLVLALDGESKFREGLRNASKQVSLNKTAIRDLTAEYKGNANSLEYLQKKQELMKSQQDALNRKLTEAKTGFDNATKTYERQKTALEELQKRQQKAVDSLDEMKKSGQEGSNEYKALESEVEKLSAAVDRQTANVLKADGRITDWQKSINTTESALRQMDNSLADNAKYISEAEKAADNCATSIDNMGKAVEGASDGGSEIGSAFGEIAVGGLRKLGEIGVEALGQVKDAAIDAAKYAVDVGSNFEAGLSEVEAISGATSREMDQLSEKARALGSSTKFSATDVTSAMTNMSLAGWRVQQTLSGIDGVLQLASASGMDLAEASQVVTDNISVFNLQAEQATQIADQMAYSQAHSSTTAAELGQAYKNCGANMNAAGQDISTTTVLLEALANKGLRSAEAGTAQAAVMRDMISKMSDGAIKIGETSVAVADANGNFRNMIDIVADIEAATDGLADSQKQEALMATFTSDSTKALNMLLSTGSDNLREMAAELDNCQGAAQSMSDIMQDNLKGAMTELGSAQEGLGIAVYNLFSGPLTGAARLATSAISGITAAITPAETEISRFLAEVKEANAEVKKTIQDSQDTMTTGQVDVANLEVYKNKLLEINIAEETNEYQKYQLKGIVSELSGSIPELSQAFDEESGKINLTNQEITDLINNQEKLVLQQAMLKAQKEAMEAYAEAVIAQAKAEAALNGLYEEGGDGLKAYNEQVATGCVVSSEQAAKYDLLNGQIVTAQKEQEKANKQLEEAEKNNKLVSDSMDELSERYGFDKEAKEEDKTATDDLADSQEGLTEAAEASADATKEAATTEYTAAQQRRDAAQVIVDAYTSAKEQISSQFQDKISLFDLFDQSEDGGTDMTVEEMTANLQSQVDAMLRYKENLQTVVDAVGDKVAPEFLQYIENMGMEGANVLEHMVITLEGQGTGPIEDMAEAWCDAMNISDRIGEVEAANDVAIQAAANVFGSSAQEWSAVWDAMTIANSNGIEAWKSGLTDELSSQLQDVISMAQQVGAAIPDGLADGIVSGDITPQEAISQLQGQIAGQMDGLLQVAQQAGIQVPQGIQDGIAAGGDATVQAYRDLITLLGDSNVDLAQVAQQQGAQYTEGLAQTDTSSAGTAMAEGAADGANQQSDGFTSAGATAGSNYNSGLESKSSAAVAIANGFGQRVMAALASRENQAYNIGANIGLGVAQGINAQISHAEASAVNTINRIMRAMQQAADIHSPSKKADKQVGQQISAGVAQGITKKSSAAAKAAADSVKKALAAAQAEARKRQQLYDITGNATWSSQIANNFGVSKTTGSGKDMKTKTQSEYYSEVMSAAETYMSNMQILYDVSAENELKYWQGVRSQLSGGTQSWYDATKKIKELREEIADNQEKAVEAAKKQHVQMTTSILSNYKNFYAVSSRAEMQYWNIIRKQFKRGSEERVNADKNYLDAKQQYYDDLSKLNEDYQKDFSDIQDKLKEKIQDLTDTYADAVSNRKSDILGQFSLFENWDSTGYDADTLLYNLQTQVSGLALWEQQFDELSKRNISSGLLDELRDMGPEAAASIYSLNQMTEEQLKQYDALWQQRDALAQNQAVKDNSGLLDDTNRQIGQLKNDAKADLDTLNREYQTKLQEIQTGISGTLEYLANNAGNMGEETMYRYIQGMESQWTALEGSGETLKLKNNITSGMSDVPEAAGRIGSDALDALLNELTNQEKIQKSLQSVTDMITADLSGLGALTGSGAQRLSTQMQMSAQSPVVNIDTSGINSSLSGMAGAVASAVVSALSGMGIYIDSDVLVGQISPQVESSIAMGSVKRSGRL